MFSTKIRNDKMQNTNETRPGYHFVGWYIDPECTKRLNPGGKLPHTVTLYDKWIPELYVVHYDCQGGINSRKNPKAITIESGVVLLHPAKKPGYVFVGWEWDGKMIQYIPEKQTQAIFLKAIFKKPSIIHFNTLGGAHIAKKQADQNNHLPWFPGPLRLGYLFLGWSYDKEGNQPFSFKDTIDHDITLYANWKLESYPIEYLCQGGMTTRKNPRSYTYLDDTIELLPAKKKGFRFIGWYDPRNHLVTKIEKGAIGPQIFIAHYEKI